MAKAKAKAKRRAKGGMTLPLAALAGFTPLVTYAMLDYKQGGVRLAASGACARLTGYNPADGQFHASLLMHGTVPIALGLLVHKFVGGKLGVNRALSNAGVPLLRL
jgi:hypothetical protein